VKLRLHAQLLFPGENMLHPIAGDQEAVHQRTDAAGIGAGQRDKSKIKGHD